VLFAKAMLDQGKEIR